MLIVSGVLVALAAALVIVSRDVLFAPRSGDVVSEQRSQPARPPAHDVVEGPATGDAAVLPGDTRIGDDGQTLWASPTDGEPLDLAYLPPGAQIILAVRPAALLDHPEGEKVLAALGPLGERGIGFVEQATGRPLRRLDQLLVGLQTRRDGAWDVALVATSKEQGAGSRERGAGSESLQVYEPLGHEGRVLVVASPAAMADIRVLGGAQPPLRRDMARVLAHSDRTRHVTWIVAPSFLFNDGNRLFSGELAKLRDPLFWFLGDGLSAVSLSMHWDANFFVELRAVPTLDTLADRQAAQLSERVDQLPDRVEDRVLGLNSSAYGRRVVARFPAMVRKVATYTRSGFEGDQAVLRCYLPAVAGHNLLMGAELTLAESLTGPPPPAGPVAEAAAPGASAEARLRQRTSLRFPRDTLEAALAMLAKDIGVEIIVLGRDLQLEGITRNQSFGLDLEDRPAEEILVEILRQANPDKSAAGPGDERQKLVYVVKPRPADGSEAVFITTRSKAAERGERLPEVFLWEASPTPKPPEE